MGSWVIVGSGIVHQAYLEREHAYFRPPKHQGALMSGHHGSQEPTQVLVYSASLRNGSAVKHYPDYGMLGWNSWGKWWIPPGSGWLNCLAGMDEGMVEGMHIIRVERIGPAYAAGPLSP